MVLYVGSYGRHQLASVRTILWPKWRKQFQQYRSYSGLDSEGEPRQVDTLFYCMGKEAESVLVSTNVIADQQSKYSDVWEI